MAVATANNKDMVTAALQRTGIAEYIQAVFSSSDFSSGKTGPDIFYTAAEYLQSEVKYTWVFEDGLYAINTAKSCGFKTVGIYDASSSKDVDAMKAICDIYMKDLCDFDYFYNIASIKKGNL